MAVKKFLLSIGQSNAAQVGSPVSDWLGVHPELNFNNTLSNVLGSYSDSFTILGGFPGYGTVNIKGLATNSIRYLTGYNPSATGNPSYPGSFRSSAATSSTTLATDQYWLAGGSAFTVTRKTNGETRTATVTTTQSLTLSSAFSSGVLINEQFSFSVLAVSGTTSSANLNASWIRAPFQNIYATTYYGSLTGLELACTAGANAGQSRIISSVTNFGQTVNVSSAFANAIVAGDAFTIRPQNAIPFHKFAMFLPWTPYEAAADSTTYPLKINPMPPGFNWPNAGMDSYPFNAFMATNRLQPNAVAYHTGLAWRLSQFYGEQIYVASLGIGATALQPTVVGLTSSMLDVGWLDPNQMRDWHVGGTNNLYARLMDVLDSANLAASLEGNTLECVGVVMVQGEGDTVLIAALDYETSLRSFKNSVRSAIKSRSMFAGAESTIPWVHPKISLLGNADTLRDAVQKLADQDPYFRTCETSDIARNVGDTIHYSALGMIQLEARCLDQLKLIASSGAVSESALVAETGSGLATANSYATLAESTAYFDARSKPSAWVAATWQQKEQSLRIATAYLDSVYGSQWVGIRQSSAQALDWPRSDAYDMAGEIIDLTVPQRLKSACAEIAARYLADPAQLMPDTESGQDGVASETVSVGPISISSSYEGSKKTAPIFHTVYRLLISAGLIESSSWAKR
jgi:hypothetical protein